MAILIGIEGDELRPDQSILLRVDLFANCIEDKRQRERCRLALWTLLMYPDDYVAYMQWWNEKEREAVRQIIDHGPGRASVIEELEVWRNEDPLLRGDAKVFLQRQKGEMIDVARLYQS